MEEKEKGGDKSQDVPGHYRVSENINSGRAVKLLFFGPEIAGSNPSRGKYHFFFNLYE